MNKVLLCYEDFSEVMALQPILKKVGFDVASISTEFSITDQLLTFNPDVVIASGKGGKVSTASVGKRLKDNPRWTGKVVLIFPKGTKPDPSSLLKIRMDVALEAPVEMTRLIMVLAHMTGQSSQTLIERVLKNVAQDARNPYVTGGAPEDSESDTVYISGSGGETQQPEDAWNVGSNDSLDEFNRLMGVPANEGSDKIKARGATAVEDPLSRVGAGEAPAESRGDAVPMDGGDDLAEAKAYAQRQLQEAQEKLKKKAKKYAETKTPEGESHPPPSRLNKTTLKRAQKDLKRNWSAKELESQDELRRQFTNTLFKKKN